MSFCIALCQPELQFVTQFSSNLRKRVTINQQILSWIFGKDYKLIHRHTCPYDMPITVLDVYLHLYIAYVYVKRDRSKSLKSTDRGGVQHGKALLRVQAATVRHWRVSPEAAAAGLSAYCTRHEKRREREKGRGRTVPRECGGRFRYIVYNGPKWSNYRANFTCV